MEPNEYGRQDSPKKKPENRSKCDDGEAATRKSIASLRQTYCTALQTAKTGRHAALKNYEQKKRIYEEKKKLFMWTEKNYRIYRDLDITVDTQLQSSNDNFKTNVAAYNTESTNLYNQLKGILSAVKDVKAKVSALRDQASNLENFKNDQCNASQWTLLTGKTMDNCKPDPNNPPVERPDACKDAEKIYNELICITKKALVFDVDYLFKSSADIVGIQTFSNISTLTGLQVNLADASKAFISQIQASAKARATDLTGIQTDLISAAQDATTAGIAEFTAISDCDGAFATLKFLCEPDCGCVIPKGEDPCQPRLHACECKICEICSEVKDTYIGTKENCDKNNSSTK